MDCCQEVKQRIAMAKEAFNRKKKHFLQTLGKRTTEETSEVFCVECSVVWCRDQDTRRNEQKQLEAFEMRVWRMMERVKRRQNKKCSCASKSGRRKSNAGTDKVEKKKLAGQLAKKELPAEGCSRTRVRKSGTLCHWSLT